MATRMSVTWPASPPGCPGDEMPLASRHAVPALMRYARRARTDRIIPFQISSIAIVLVAVA